MPSGPAGPRTQSGISPNSIRDQAIIPRHIHDDLKWNQYAKFLFPGPQPLLHAGNGYGAPTGSDTDENVAVIPGFPPLELAYYVNGAATVLGPAVDLTNGYLVASLDGAASEGVEYVPGGAVTAHNPLATVVGTDKPMFLRLKVALETVANVAEFGVGFRKAEAFQAGIDNYDEMAAFNVQAGDVEIHTILNGADTVEVDTGDDMADGVARTLEVWLMGRTLRFFVDGAQYKSTFQFDSGEVVIPFIHVLNGGGASDMRWYELEIGRLWHLKKDINRR